MSWITEANKLGKYDSTHGGFRIYIVKEARTIEKTIIKNGKELEYTLHIPSHRIAIDKYGVQFEGDLHQVSFKIDMEMMARRFDQREKGKKSKK